MSICADPSKLVMISQDFRKACRIVVVKTQFDGQVHP